MQEQPPISPLLVVPQPDGSTLPFRQLLDALPAAAYTCDASGLITYYNEHAVATWGRAPRLNEPVDRFCGSFKLHSADEKPIPHDDCWMARALRERRKFNGEEIIVERPDGSRITVLAHANPILDGEGNLLGAVNVLVDISDRKRGEQAQAQLAAIVASSEDAIISKTLDGKILSWNASAERMFGYSAEEAIGQSILLIIPPDRIDEEKHILAKLRRGERIEHFETERITRSGRRIHISLSVSPVRDATGRIIGASKVARDITGRKEAELALLALNEQLCKADRRKDEFLATLAHELRNPLAPISTSLQILSLADDVSPAVAQVREIMKRQVNHLVRLVDDLLEVSRITRGNIELRRERVDLMSILASALETSRPLIDAARHQLAITLSPEPMPVQADPVRLAQVVSNLLNNAAKYTDEGGQIWLTARREASEAVVSVRDTGIGIPADMLPRIFDLFTQVDGAKTRAQGGLGIGLTLARTLVEMHGGSLTVHSDGPGRGSEFILRLPLLVDVPQPATELVVAPRGNKFVPRRILVVDDSHAAAYTFAKLLEALGHNVRTAANAQAALALVRQERPDVVISDIGMPHMNGHELARRLRQDPSLEGVVLVALTGYGQDDDKQAAQEAGFDYHLVKPVNLDAIHELLGSLPEPREAVPAVESMLTAHREDR